MDGYINHYAAPRRDTRCTPLSTAANGLPISAAMLTDPKELKKLANGTTSTTNSHLNAPSPSGRRNSEPPVSSNLITSPIVKFTSFKEDAYDILEKQGRNKKPTNAPVVNRPPPTRFDPRQLLDPKGFKPNQQQNDSVVKLTNLLPTHNPPVPHHQQDKEAPHPTDFGKHDHEGSEGQGQGSLIEQVHNVTNREERPSKKRKTEDGFVDGDEQRVGTFRGGKGGELGQYVKDKRREGQEHLGSAGVIVDLTKGGYPRNHKAFHTKNTLGDDEDVVLVCDSADKEVCYGRLDHAKVQAHLVPNPSSKSTLLGRNDWPAMKIKLHRFPGKDNIIRVVDPTGKDFGNVDVRTSLGLARIMDSKNPRFRTQARLNLRRRKPDEYPGKECSEYLDMILNLYGPKSSAVRIGKFLSQKQLYLRAPFSVDTGIEVVNPHAPVIAPRTSLPGMSAGLVTTAGYVSRTVEEIRSDVIGMFDSLEKSDNLPEMEPDPKIITPLLSHQKQGLYFMTHREKERVYSDEEEGNNSLWRLKLRANGQRMYYNIITGHEERTKPPEVLGGILADMMGLGKTLSILSLIVGSLREAQEWAKQVPAEDKTEVPVCNLKTTLLVSPMSTMTNWEEQIGTHIAPNSLSYYVYHGSNRNQDIDHLSRFDVIITTYSTVSSEIYGRGKKKDVSPLAQINFFRIVLDEAHMIREQSTRQSQAICTLSAQRRWAVTGTPVQNRLDDLGALIKFLRVKPFNEKHGFAQFILSPFKNADPEILPKLRLLVDSITLRRLKDRIDLPPRHDRVVRLPFSDEEFTLYEWFAKDSDNKMKIIASENKKSLGGKTYVHILRAIMRLRLLCAHGRELLSEDDLKITEGFSMNNAIDLEDEGEDERPVLSCRQAYEMLMLFKETNGDNCAQCARKIGFKDNELENTSSSNDIIGYMMPCYQIVCRDCFLDMKKSLEQKNIILTDNQQRFTCPYCDQYMRTSFFELTQQGIDSAEEERQDARENPRKAKIMGRYGGPHTKTKALLEALKESHMESQGLDRPIKSVIFSGWTSHLDLIQIALEDNGIKFARLDGKMTRNKRTQALDAFREDEETTVFLISIGAGGLGLNLTTGSKVYIMEPQFNPAAEAQAVDRIHRLGQTREVTTTRFIMENSFEEKMLDLQRKKQNLADLSMNRGKLDKAEAAKQRLEELRSLFK